MKGYTGKILRVNLTDRKISTLDTKNYEQWVGGHGIGSAIFWELCEDKTISGFDPRNVVTIMTSPISGTLTPSASGRTEVQGIGVQSYPVEWYTRSNFGGRFAPMLKFAGWDGVVIEGKADKPVWLDIRDGNVEIKDAGNLWGLDTFATQEEIWREINGDYSEWYQSGTNRDAGRTTQRSAVLTIGQAGENLSRTAALIHDAGNGAGQGGFGAVWGAKNLKAVSVLGTGSFEVANPSALLQARINAKENYAVDVENPTTGWTGGRFGSAPTPVTFYDRLDNGRPQSCMGCISGCRSRQSTGLGNESSCVETSFYGGFDKAKHGGKSSRDAYVAADLLQKYGINAYEAYRGLEYIRALNKMGILGPGKELDCPLDFSELGTAAFADKFLRMIAYREGIGDDFAEGFFRAAKRWGRLEEDLKSGILEYPYWGLPEHAYDPRAEIEWGYGTILGDRDINEHDFNGLYWTPSKDIWMGKTPYLTAEEVADIISEKLMPYEGDPLMVDYGDDNIYSDHIVKMVAWHRHYTRFWKQSVLYCDFRWADFFNAYGPNNRGLTGEDGEPVFLNAVTGGEIGFVDGVKLGEKIWNLDNAIWILQGRHRDMVKFSDYIYDQPFDGGSYPSYWLPGRENGEWKYINTAGRKLDREKFEDWKTRFYEFEGWDPKTGWPKRETLESLDLKEVADELAKHGKLGE